jgi:hypothetical protein
MIAYRVLGSWKDSAYRDHTLIRVDPDDIADPQADIILVEQTEGSLRYPLPSQTAALLYGRTNSIMA